MAAARRRTAIAILAAGLVLGALPARPTLAGDVRGQVELLPRTGERAGSRPVVFLRGNGMVTTRRGGPERNDLDLLESGFDRHVLVARLGDTLRVTNRGPTPSHVFFFREALTRVAGPLEPSRSFRLSLDRYGPLEIYAAGGPSAWVLVVENPFQKGVGEDGTFLLDGVTPGLYDVCAWAPGRAVTCVPAEVPLEGEARARIRIP